MKNLTPDNMRCGSLSPTCPAVYQLPAPDTRLLIIGSNANAIAKWMNDNKIQVGDNETAVIIERELLANALKQE